MQYSAYRSSCQISKVLNYKLASRVIRTHTLYYFPKTKWICSDQSVWSLIRYYTNYNQIGLGKYAGF